MSSKATKASRLASHPGLVTHPCAFAVWDVMFDGVERLLQAEGELPVHPKVPSWVRGDRRGYPWERLVRFYGVTFMREVFEVGAGYECESARDAETLFIASLKRSGYTGYERATHQEEGE